MVSFWVVTLIMLYDYVHMPMRHMEYIWTERVIPEIITLGRGPIYTKSSKQKAVTKSSCEAEVLVLSLSEIVSTVAWIRDFL